MQSSDPVIRNISDTARWVAMFRANETDRADAVFRDPFARVLAGERGAQIAASMRRSARDEWPFVARTFLFDEFISREIAAGCDTVINLAAGLDARPYRMALPPTLRWVEIDLPEILAEKEQILRGEKAACAVERIPLDLRDVAARRAAFERIAGTAKKVLVIAEGLIVYLDAGEVRSLADDLARVPVFQRWVLDIGSPGLLRMMQRAVGRRLDAAGAPFKFAPAEGPAFFVPHGWRPTDVRSMLKTAAKLRRLPWFLRLMALLPESKGPPGSRPWAGVCLLHKERGAEAH